MSSANIYNFIPVAVAIIAAIASAFGAYLSLKTKKSEIIFGEIIRRRDELVKFRSKIARNLEDRIDFQEFMVTGKGDTNKLIEKIVHKAVVDADEYFQVRHMLSPDVRLEIEFLIGRYRSSANERNKADLYLRAAEFNDGLLKFLDKEILYLSDALWRK